MVKLPFASRVGLEASIWETGFSLHVNVKDKLEIGLSSITVPVISSTVFPSISFVCATKLETSGAFLSRSPKSGKPPYEPSYKALGNSIEAIELSAELV